MIWLLFCLTLPAQSPVSAATQAPAATVGRASSAAGENSAPPIVQNPPNLEAEVRRLIRNLDATERAVREAAERDLRQLGPSILGLLPPVSARTPAETKVRLERVRKALETELASQAALASRITLEGELPFTAALAALAKQSGNAITGYETLETPVRVAWKETSFWQALDDLLDQVGLTVDPLGGQAGTLVLRARPETQGKRATRAVYAGPFRLEPIRLSARRDLQDDSVSALGVTFSVAWEPRLKPISLRLALQDLVLKDDLEQTLPPTGNQAGVLTPLIESDFTGTDLELRVALPDRRARQIRSLSGTFTAVIPGATHEFTFSDLAQTREVEQRHAGVVVVYEGLRKNGDLYDLRVRLRFDQAAGALQSHLGWISTNEAFIRTANNEQLNNLGMTQRTRQENEVGFSYLFDLPGGPTGCRFVYKTPSLLIQVPITFEMRDLPLP